LQKRFSSLGPPVWGVLKRLSACDDQRMPQALRRRCSLRNTNEYPRSRSGMQRQNQLEPKTGARVLVPKLNSPSRSIERFAIDEGQPDGLFRDLLVCAVLLICRREVCIGRRDHCPGLGRGLRIACGHRTSVCAHGVPVSASAESSRMHRDRQSCYVCWMGSECSMFDALTCLPQKVRVAMCLVIGRRQGRAP
jgi:hypothetical protein